MKSENTYGVNAPKKTWWFVFIILALLLVALVVYAKVWLPSQAKKAEEEKVAAETQKVDPYKDMIEREVVTIRPGESRIIVTGFKPYSLEPSAEVFARTRMGMFARQWVKLAPGHPSYNDHRDVEAVEVYFSKTAKQPVSILVERDVDW